MRSQQHQDSATRAAVGALATVLLLAACAATQTPPTRPATAAVRAQATPATTPAVDGWAAYRRAADCDPNAQPAVAPPNPVVTAWTAVDGCRVLVASPDGLAAVTAAGDVIPLDRLDELDQTLSVAAVADTIWVSGTSGGSPALLRLSAGKRSKVALPPGVDTVGTVVATAAGVFITAIAGHANVLLRLEGSRAAKVGGLPGEPTAFAAAGGGFLATVSSVRGTQVAVGSGPAWRTHTVGSTLGVGIRGVAAGHGLLVVAANKLIQGVPSGGLFLISRDQGRTWVRHELGGAEVESVAVAGGSIYVEMTRQGNSATLYRSTDATAWTAVPTQVRYESLPNLSVAGSTLWLVGNPVTRIATAR